jgi:hypothetical protein
MEHNNIIYTKEQVLESEELKEILLKQLKKQELLIRKREISRLYRITHKEQVNLYQKNKKYHDYHNDDEYRKKYLEKKKVALYNRKIILGISSIPLKRGRKQMQALGDDLQLYDLF